MDWFESLTGFRERNYDDTRAKLGVEGDRLHSLVNGRRYGIGKLELVSLSALRERARTAGGLAGRLKVSIVSGDVRKMHRAPENASALFQVASQFNLLEMVGPDVTPEHGVSRYEQDHTQGPACAVAAGAATIYRNYFVSVDGQAGQTTERQLDELADVGAALSIALNRPVSALWKMQNGYALCIRSGLEVIAEYLRTLQPAQLDELRGKLRIGVHRDVEVTDGGAGSRPLVSQAFCSALPIAYSHLPAEPWESFAMLVLEAAYEATMSAAVLNAQRGASKVVFLTFLGGGVFGNDEQWIHAAIRRALRLMAGFELDVRFVSYGAPSRAVVQLAEEWSKA
jgi:hypothetical protein